MGGTFSAVETCIIYIDIGAMLISKRTYLLERSIETLDITSNSFELVQNGKDLIISSWHRTDWLTEIEIRMSIARSLSRQTHYCSMYFKAASA